MKIKDFLNPIFKWAMHLKNLHEAKKLKELPVVTVSYMICMQNNVRICTQLQAYTYHTAQ